MTVPSAKFLSVGATGCTGSQAEQAALTVWASESEHVLTELNTPTHRPIALASIERVHMSNAPHICRRRSIRAGRLQAMQQTWACRPLLPAGNQGVCSACLYLSATAQLFVPQCHCSTVPRPSSCWAGIPSASVLGLVIQVTIPPFSPLLLLLVRLGGEAAPPQRGIMAESPEPPALQAGAVSKAELHAACRAYAEAAAAAQGVSLGLPGCDSKVVRCVW